MDRLRRAAYLPSPPPPPPSLLNAAELKNIAPPRSPGAGPPSKLHAARCLLKIRVHPGLGDLHPYSPWTPGPTLSLAPFPSC